ncbi:MAG: hypothetical protein LBR65_02725 [Culturomica sp.]|jgi:hypothetical protein|nr:hypothetical protein [Culturomica sp.]
MYRTVITIYLLSLCGLLCAQQTGEDNSRWLNREQSSRHGSPELSAWHTGTAGIIRSDAAELNLTSPSKIGFSKNTELQLRIGEELFMPNIGIRRRWRHNERLHLTTEHSLHYTWPVLELLRSTGFKELIPDTATLGQGVALRNEVQFSWLMNPQIPGCPPSPERILTARAGAEFYAGAGKSGVVPFDWFHALYHTQILDGKTLWYGGVQFDSYFLQRFHYSLNLLCYSVDLKKDYALEGNARLTWFFSRRMGISASCRAACVQIAEAVPAENAGHPGRREAKLRVLPLVDLTYLVNPGRGGIQHGLFKSSRRKR